MAAGDYVFRLSHLTGMGMSSINANDATPVSQPGHICFVQDAFGYKVLKYVRATATLAQGACASRYGGVNGTTVITNLDSGSTTTALKSAAWTANAEVGAVFYVHDDAGAAGAAPEGEISVVVSNTAGQLNLDPLLPLTAALAVNDDVTTISTYQCEGSADGDLSVTCLGIVAASGGITSGNYGWVIMEGVTKAKATTNAITTFNPIVCGSSCVDAFGTDGQELWIGTSLGTYAADNAALTLPVRMNCFTASGIGTSP